MDASGLRLPYRIRKVRNKYQWRITSSMFPGRSTIIQSHVDLDTKLINFFTYAMYNQHHSGKRYPTLSKRQEELLLELPAVLSYKWALWNNLHDKFDDAAEIWKHLTKPLGISAHRADLITQPYYRSRLDTLIKANNAMGFGSPCWHCYNSTMKEVPYVRSPR